ncbi:MAG: hypothetical protein J6K42_01380 [Clostridia bacterium]|nr:hypothetical protein [Clostridia bacterium]
MDINKRDIIISIVTTLIILVILALVILVQLNKSNKINNTEAKIDYYNQYQQQRASEGVTANDAVASLEGDANKYYTVKSIIDSFNTYISYLNSTISDLGLIVPSGEEEQALQEYRQDGLNYITNMLANNYKTKYSINNENLYNLLKNYSGKSYEITDMYVVRDSEYINTYFIYGKYLNEEFDYIVVLDKYNYTFEIYLNNYVKDGKYSKDDVSTMKTLNIEKIDQNDNNTFQYKNINKDELVKIYYEEYLNQMTNNVQEAYNLLDSEYKSIRFKTLEEFQNYINEVIKVEFPRKVSTYKLKNCENYIEYVCQDNYGNIFVFKVTGVKKYTVILDTYTVPIKSYEEEYKNANDSKRAQLCLNRFFEALNNKNYEKAYNYLNSSFRNNNFKTVEEFKKYVQTNWFDFNMFSYLNLKKDGEYYVLSGEIADTILFGSYNSESISKDFILKLGNSIKDFQISFNK